MQHRADLVREVVTNEDYWMTASIQAGIASGAQETVVFGRNEQALHHYHRGLLERVSRTEAVPGHAGDGACPVRADRRSSRRCRWRPL